MEQHTQKIMHYPPFGQTFWRYGQAVKTLVFLTRIPSSNLGSVIKNDTAKPYSNITEEII